MKSEKHYEAWPLAESKQFIESYLKGVTRIDQSVLCKQIAVDLGRSTAAVKLRVLEVKRILDRTNEYPIITPNMELAVDWAISELGYSKNRILNLC
jgi:hypothetical protein